MKPTYRKTFTYRERVRVVRPGKRTITGFYYSEYESNQGRRICVEVKSGAGVSFPARQVRKIAP